MPRGDQFVQSLLPGNAPRSSVRARNLSYLEAATLQTGLVADAGDFYYSAWVTFLDALQGAHGGFYTWATVKLYYSIFYCLRAGLADRGLCAFHVGRTQYIVRAVAGMAPTTSGEPGTHRTVLREFGRQNPGHLLQSQKIGV